MKRIKWAALVFAILLILNACGSHDVTRQIEGGRNGGLFSQILPA